MYILDYTQEIKKMQEKEKKNWRSPLPCKSTRQRGRCRAQAHGKELSAVQKHTAKSSLPCTATFCAKDTGARRRAAHGNVTRRTVKSSTRQRSSAHGEERRTAKPYTTQQRAVHGKALWQTAATRARRRAAAHGKPPAHGNEDRDTATDERTATIH